ncbi:MULTISPECIES: DUF2089 domain-containing protein [unclassified Treponema]|uniref:DUF2089 domain-containing protein n=1 Tax=unclassified Treponema TaxID=2638727 RepID=UPI0020A5B2D3|nr:MULTISPECIES: DUF2089 domain-containing protein [unclassified Treponema]UTC66943.1 DUF2089 domain-containing protein [Treponema sp. OMZ 789]UTC69672.1 DUF2089 domain-containing protein [Treponema sp. OMZ 790]UTC72386.1 DUF2089 domain-containing protein [Treponema sp. OMZ 791]
MTEVMGNCPVCGEAFTVSELHCTKCNSSLKGEFELCEFCRLTKEQKYFVKMFLKNRGSIRDMEKELGISYPTVRNKIEEINAALGLSDGSLPSVNVSEVLKRIKAGELSVDSAVSFLTGQSEEDKI